MEILIISHKFPPSTGGMEKHCYELVSHLKQADRVTRVHEIIYDNQEGKFWFFWRLRSNVKKYLRKHPNVNIIYLNDGLMAAFSTWIKDITDIPVVVTIHGLDIVFPWSYFQRKIIPRLHRLDRVISVSQATRQACIDRGFRGDQVVAIANGVDHDLATMAQDGDILNTIAFERDVPLKSKRVLVTLGRPVKRKGFSWFVKKVMPRLNDDVVFLMIGPISDNPSKKTLIDYLPTKAKALIQLFMGMSSDERVLDSLLKSGNYKNCYQLGKLPFDQVMALLGAADLFVMPNIKVDGDAEGFGLVALEAALRKVTVLAAGIEGITDAIHDGKNGYLLASEDVDAWVGKIDKQLQLSQDDLHAFAKSAQKYTIDNFGWQRMGDGYIDVFEDVISSIDSRR